MLTSIAGLSCFIGSISLRLSLLFSMHRGILAQDGENCVQYQYNVVLDVKFLRPSPKCDSFLGVPNFWKTMKAWTAAEPACEPLPACEVVCAERTADLIYSIARTTADACIHILNANNSASWDILFRHPKSPLTEADANSQVCICKLGMAVQRVITRHPLQSDSASTSANRPSPSAPVLNNDYCEPFRIVARHVSSDRVLQQQSWYPKPAYTAVLTNPEYKSQDNGWDKSLPDMYRRVDCDAEFQDIFADIGYNTLPRGLDPSQSSNCTIKYHVGNKSHPGHNVLCCKGEYMAPIMKRIELLHISDLRNKRHENIYIKACMSLPLPNDMLDLIAEKLASGSQLEWKLSQMRFM
ncbi:hypothetical protein BCR37DRAFT_406454 [Protomyces lactucae-debilis]|uniref:Uncharacterized protein n=1 Tax=Protomyces lactucae-debilis TaxID=2754530 RepID=A0A1Y2EVZ4_PROLT|nr:uncharacterized protein BCR37DRAFT_406454 [Protomyces lactucae-debilis]ORY75771.1 hypothetical protein BCR37DRAFT_406454 [Protomyces lactucae-debilis]